MGSRSNALSYYSDSDVHSDTESDDFPHPPPQTLPSSAARSLPINALPPSRPASEAGSFRSTGAANRQGRNYAGESNSNGGVPSYTQNIQYDIHVHGESSEDENIDMNIHRTVRKGWDENGRLVLHAAKTSTDSTQQNRVPLGRNEDEDEDEDRDRVEPSHLRRKVHESKRKTSRDNVDRNSGTSSRDKRRERSRERSLDRRDRSRSRSREQQNRSRERRDMSSERSRAGSRDRSRTQVRKQSRESLFGTQPQYPGVSGLNNSEKSPYLGEQPLPINADYAAGFKRPVRSYSNSIVDSTPRNTPQSFEHKRTVKNFKLYQDIDDGQSERSYRSSRVNNLRADTYAGRQGSLPLIKLEAPYGQPSDLLERARRDSLYQERKERQVPGWDTSDTLKKDLELDSDYDQENDDDRRSRRRQESRERRNSRRGSRERRSSHNNQPANNLKVNDVAPLNGQYNNDFADFDASRGGIASPSLPESFHESFRDNQFDRYSNPSRKDSRESQSRSRNQRRSSRDSRSESNAFFEQGTDKRDDYRNAPRRSSRDNRNSGTQKDDLQPINYHIPEKERLEDGMDTARTPRRQGSRDDREPSRRNSRDSRRQNSRDDRYERETSRRSSRDSRPAPPRVNSRDSIQRDSGGNNSRQLTPVRTNSRPTDGLSPRFLTVPLEAVDEVEPPTSTTLPQSGNQSQNSSRSDDKDRQNERDKERDRDRSRDKPRKQLTKEEADRAEKRRKRKEKEAREEKEMESSDPDHRELERQVKERTKRNTRRNSVSVSKKSKSQMSMDRYNREPPKEFVFTCSAQTKVEDCQFVHTFIAPSRSDEGGVERAKQEFADGIRKHLKDVPHWMREFQIVTFVIAALTVAEGKHRELAM